LLFDKKVTPTRLLLTFQGGFVGTRCSIEVFDSSRWRQLSFIYPEDVNRKQSFDLAGASDVEGLKIVFEESSDFFGRITVYDLQLDGNP
jgi:hypothetical protein